MSADSPLPTITTFAPSLAKLKAIAFPIPSFATNVTLPNQAELGRIAIPILDDEAKMDFYISYKTENRQKIANFLNLV